MFTYRTFKSLKSLPQPKPFIFGVLATTVVAGSLCYAYDLSQQRYPRNLNAALDYYNFRTAEQKRALRYLMQKAGIQDTDVLLDRKARSPDELVKSILTLVQETQDKFTVRTGNQERWDVQTAGWMQDPKQQAEALEALETLNMMRAVSPGFEKPDAICVLGASRSVMVSRLNYAGDLVAANQLSAQWLLMLAGERYVTPDKKGIQVDGSEQELKALAEQIGKSISTLTETDLMREAHKNSLLNGKFPHSRVVLIDTPRGNLPRPTTETTVAALCEWLKQHPEVRKITFISNQPHVAYQRAIIAQVFEKQRVELQFEAVGPEYIPVVDNEADKINYIMQALGSRIWATTPEVLDTMGLDISDPKLREAYMALYKKQPLIYNNLQSKLTKPRV